MPRSVQTRKTPINRELQDTRSPTIEVAQSQRIRPERVQNKEITRFLGNLATYAGERASANVKEERESLLRQAQVGVVSGDIDQELYEDKEVYREAVDTLNSEKDSLAIRIEARAGLADAMAAAEAEGVEFDIDTYKASFRDRFFDSDAADSEFYAAGGAANFTKLDAELDQMYLQKDAAMQLAEAESAGAGYAFQAMRAGGFDYKATKAKLTADLDFSPNDADGIIVTAAQSFLAQASTEADLAIYDSIQGDLSDKQKAHFGDEIVRSYRVAKGRIEAAAKTKDNKLTLEQLKEVRDVDRAIEDANATQLDIDQLKEKGFLTKSEYLSRSDKLYDKVTEDRKKAVQEGRFLGYLQNPDQAALAEDHSEFKDWWDTQTVPMGRELLSISAEFLDSNADPREVRTHLYQALEESRWHIEQGQKFGFTPPFIKRYLSTAKDPAVGTMASVVELASALKDTFGSGVLADVPDEAASNLQAYRTLTTDQQMTPEDAVATLTQEINGLDYGRAQRVITSSEEFKDFLDDNSDSRSYTTLGDAVKTLAAYQLMLTGDREAAVEWAEDRLESTHMDIDGYTVSRANVRAGFAEAYEEGKDDLRDWLEASDYIDEDADFALVPTGGTSSTGQFRVMSDGLLLASDNGEHYVWSAEEILAKIGVAKAAAQKEREEDAADRQKLLQRIRANQAKYDVLYTTPKAL